MHEYALMRGGSVINVVMTSRSATEVQETLIKLMDHPADTQVVPIEQVSQRALLNYRYWGVRP